MKKNIFKVTFFTLILFTGLSLSVCSNGPSGNTDIDTDNGTSVDPGGGFYTPDTVIAGQTFRFPFIPPENNIPIISGITISQTGTESYPATGILTLTNPEDYSLIEWFYGSVKLGEGPSLELDGSNILYNLQGSHNIIVVAWEDGVPYSLRISFVVVG